MQHFGARPSCATAGRDEDQAPGRNCLTLPLYVSNMQYIRCCVELGSWLHYTVLISTALDTIVNLVCVIMHGHQGNVQR